MKKSILIILLTVLAAKLQATDVQEYIKYFYAASMVHTAPNVFKDDQALVLRNDQFYKISISESLPMLISLLESGQVTNRIEATKSEGVITNQAVAFADLCAFKMMNLTFGMDSLGTICFPWLTGKGNDLTISSVNYHYFWWYEGRKYLPQIWNEWYECWRSETTRENPRTIILEQLANEITGLGYHIFPYLNDCLESDKTLALVVETMRKPGRGNRVFGDFRKWYQEKGSVLSLPPCETLKVAEKRFNLERLPLSKATLNRMKLWQANAEKYYSNVQINTNYWYYKIDPQIETVSEEDIFNAKYVR